MLWCFVGLLGLCCTAVLAVAADVSLFMHISSGLNVIALLLHVHVLVCRSLVSFLRDSFNVL